MSHTRLRRPSRPFVTPTLLDLPREVVRNIALHIYDPLELSQQDRLTWGIFSTVDMHEERQDALAALISFGKTCRKVRREVRVVQFRCIRTPTTRDVDTVVRNADNWAHYVRSIIIDLNMFDHDENGSSAASGAEEVARQPKRGRRTCWHESTLLTNLIQSLPNLNHISFFADASDDATLALLFASLIPHPSTHSIPPPTVPSSPSVRSTSSGYHPVAAAPQPFASRVRSFGWRQRAAPPAGFRQFAQSSTFVAPLHLIRHAHRLSFLVLDADLQEMDKEDVLIACKDLSLRAPPLGEEAEKVSLMLCGPIRGWSRDFLVELTGTFTGIKELFVDRPLRKSLISHETTFEDFTSLLEPLGQMPHLQLLQVGSYIFPIPLQTAIAFHLAQTVSSLLVLGLLGEEGETNWWGIWRNASKRVPAVPPEGLHDALNDVALVPLGDGHLRRLEIEGRLGGVEMNLVDGRVEGMGDQI